MTDQPDQLDNAELKEMAEHVAAKTYPNYSSWVEREDVTQEVLVYALGAGHTALLKFAAGDEMFRVWRALFGVARQYCEREKAARSGYEFSDIAWYTPEKLGKLMPLALNGSWDGMSGASDDDAQPPSKAAAREGGNLVAMICDIRRVLGKYRGWSSLDDFDAETEEGMARLVAVAELLGGEYPEAPGYQRARRQVVSNARAISETEGKY